MSEPLRSPDPWVLTDCPMTESERELERVQGSWADFAYGARPGTPCRMVRSPMRAGVRCDSLLTVGELLNLWHRKLQEGDRSAIWNALETCAGENVPLPYWLGDEVLRIGHLLRKPPEAGEAPGDLHSLFGMDEPFPTSKKRGTAARRNFHIGQKLFLMAARFRDKGQPEGKAIAAAQKELKFELSASKARRLYLAVSHRQEEALSVMRRNVSHRL